MQKRKLRYIADVLEEAIEAEKGLRNQIGFNMAPYASDLPTREPQYARDVGTVDRVDACGTVACIAGWTVALFNRDGELRERPLTAKQLLETRDISGMARETLGLTAIQTENLFAPNLDIKLQDVDPRAAVHALRSLADTGTPEWPEEYGYEPYTPEDYP